MHLQHNVYNEAIATYLIKLNGKSSELLLKRVAVNTNTKQPITFHESLL